MNQAIREKRLDDVRRFYAEEIRAVANVRSEALIEAFARVPREDFLGPGPWQIMTVDSDMEGGRYRSTPDANPRHLYHNILLAIDPVRQLNNGHPSSLASWLDALDLQAGDRVLHVGCGVGYYTAIMAEVVGAAGHVVGIEIDPDLAARARANLASLPQVEVLSVDGAAYDSGPTDAILINAGATHPLPVWLDSLRPGGRLIVPLTFMPPSASVSSGMMLRVKREAAGYSAGFVSPVSIYPCLGARDEAANQRLLAALQRRGWGSVRSLRRDGHEADATCWLHGEGFCLSTEMPTTE